MGIRSTAVLLLTRAWVWGSLFLPCMLLLRWGAARWNVLRGLTSSRRRWVSLWAAMAFAGTAVPALVVWQIGPPYGDRGSELTVGLEVLSLLGVPDPGVATALVLGAVVWATGEAALFCGLAALAYWLYAHTRPGIAAANSRNRYPISSVLAACALGAINHPYFQHLWCYDCSIPRGVPFPYVREGGLAPTVLIWSGVLADFAVFLALAFTFALIWRRLGRATSESPSELQRS